MKKCVNDCETFSGQEYVYREICDEIVYVLKNRIFVCVYLISNP